MDETGRPPIVSILAALVLLGIGLAHARDDGRYANSPLKPNKGGVQCCEVADGMALSDVDWDTRDGHYRVRLDGQWVAVPDDRVLTQPNRIGRPIVWS